MSANCPECSWTGTSSQVIDGGRCPECRSRITYTNKPLQSAPRISDVAEFNRRAAKAVSGLDDASDFLQRMAQLIQRGRPLTVAQQKTFTNIVHQRRREISDRQVNEYAELHARGYSS